MLSNQDIIHVRADNVARMLFSEKDGEGPWSFAENYVNCRLPFSGGAIFHFSIQQNDWKVSVAECPYADLPAKLVRGGMVEGASYGLICHLTKGEMEVMMAFPLDANGRLLPGSLYANGRGHKFKCNAAFNGPETVKYKDGFITVCLPVLAAINLMHCKNVRIVDNQPSRQQRRYAERNGYPPPIIYKTLEIATSLRKTMHPNTNSIGNDGYSLHIARGHFKDYREGPGLGKFHVHGIWWWPMHVRGNIEKGIIFKDYEVSP